MDISTFIQALLALGTIVGGAIAAYATYRSTNSSVKVQEKQIGLEEARVKKELGSFGVEEAERISNISLSNLQFMQQFLVECGNERSNLREENNKLKLEVTQREIRSMKRLSRIKEIADKLAKLDVKEDSACYIYINEIIGLVSEVISEMESTQ